jgi:hypothetical protein
MTTVHNFFNTSPVVGCTNLAGTTHAASLNRPVMEGQNVDKGGEARITAIIQTLIDAKQ